jgi:MtaA/CmuA family methyltransferase
MTGRELVIQAIEGKGCERVPWVPFCGVHSGSLIGKTAEEFLKSADLIVEGQAQAIKRYKPDGLPIVFDLQIEAEILGCELNWTDENPPAVISHPLELGEKTLVDLCMPEKTDGRIPVIMDAGRRLREAYPDIALYGLITGPFTLALHLLGTNIFMDMFDKPEYVVAVMDFCSKFAQRMADFYAEIGADVVAVVDPMTSQIGPDQFQQFCTAPSVKLFEHIRKQGMKGSFFVCGHAQQNIEVMCQTHCDSISIDENIPLDYVKDVCTRHGVGFGGNMQLTVVLLTGTPDDSRRNAIECMEIGGDTGFVLAPGCDIPYATPPENLEAVAEVVHDEYARQVAREMAKDGAEAACAFDMSEYGRSDRVIVDIITLDSEGCAPCQYMVEAVKQVAPQFEGIVEWREHKIKYRESIAFMSSLMVHNIPTICIDGQITFVSRIPPREELIAAIQRQVNSKMKLRIESQVKVIRVMGAPSEQCREIRERVQTAIKELGTDVRYEEIEDEEVCRQRFGAYKLPAVAIAKQRIKSFGTIPEKTAIKEWLKQLDE